MKVVKTALVLGHGNAEVERGFSESGKGVTDERVRLSEASINGIRATTDGLKAFKVPGPVPVTKQLPQMGRSAHAHNVTRLEKEPRSSLLCRKTKDYKWKRRNKGLPKKRKTCKAKRNSWKGKKQLSKIAWKLDMQF